MTKAQCTRYWIYYTSADFIGIFTGIVIYGLFVFPTAMTDIFRLPPGTVQLAGASGSIFYFWYIKTLYLPILAVTFFFALKNRQKKREYLTTYRIVILLLYLGLMATMIGIQDGYQFYIPMACVLFFNVVAFYLFESRDRYLT